MRIKIKHKTQYVYSEPAKSWIAMLRLTPQNHNGQYVSRWRLEVDHDCRLMESFDAYGNLCHFVSIYHNMPSITIIAEGDIETQETHGVIDGAIEPLPPSVYLRNTPLTIPGKSIHNFIEKQQHRFNTTDKLANMHALMQSLFEYMTFDTDPTHVATTAEEAMHLKRGVCQDLSHAFIAISRQMGVPSRYVSGHLFRADGIDQEAAHAWVESYIPNLGWVGFDPTNCICPNQNYVRVASGLDYLDVSPVRGSHKGGTNEQLDVHVNIIGQ